MDTEHWEHDNEDEVTKEYQRQTENVPPWADNLFGYLSAAIMIVIAVAACLIIFMSAIKFGSWIWNL
jgi:hypothetical protein